MGYLTSEKAQKKIRERERWIERQRVAALQAVMATPEGRRFVSDLIYNRCRWGGAYATNDSGLYRHEGRRAVGVELIAELESHCYDLYVLMVTERMAAQHDDKAARDAAITVEPGEEDA